MYSSNSVELGGGSCSHCQHGLVTASPTEHCPEARPWFGIVYWHQRAGVIMPHGRMVQWDSVHSRNWWKELTHWGKWPSRNGKYYLHILTSPNLLFCTLHLPRQFPQTSWLARCLSGQESIMGFPLPGAGRVLCPRTSELICLPGIFV